ncbi:putative serine protease K12H4.7 [Choristoneura fumiferana]|uniref:putative serine protease K12H4.7 n=1 Tax=Choristoneura fumiferana TaxID=7141 RepID=UPI003D15A89E
MHWFFILSICLLEVVTGRHFHLGRSKYGNLGAPADSNGLRLPKAQWFKQKLDHSSSSDQRTWKQRYYVNDSFYDFNNPGPVFLMIGGEGPADPRWMVKGAWIDYAKKFNALCINLEHRYYGESHPTQDLSVKNLQYLSSSQALADLANFIHAMNNKYKFSKDIKWIAFGGSYPGSLAAWLRLKYPHLIHASISSSGPLLAKVDFIEYFQVVIGALREKTGNDDCSTQIKQAHREIIDLMKKTPRVVEKEFKVCKPFASASVNDLNNFYSSLADDFAGLVQYNEDNRISADERYKNLTINTVCSMLTDDGDRPAYKKLAAFNSIMLDKSNQTCMDYSYDNMIKDLRNTTWSPEGARQWTYQTCTEFGFYQTSSGEIDFFGNNFPLDFYIQQCQDIFGKKFNKDFVNAAAEWTNNYYGSLDIPVSRVVYVHGSVDPWHALGITKTRDDASPAIYIHGTAHCANMYPPGDKDLPELREARVKIEEHLSSWFEMV